MPCFKGLAVSIHTADGPLPEYSIQKQSKHARITTYIPVPAPQIPSDSTTQRPEQASFAISVTLLTPGMRVPYSRLRSSSRDGSPVPQMVGFLPTMGSERGIYDSVIRPYEPLTSSANETVAAYIYFDGRGKEEVATLLRRGEETWVNSRWVSVPESEGGGLAEREFLFREVGLERWLNGLDLDGKDVDARIKRRRERLEKRRRRKKDAEAASLDMDMDHHHLADGPQRTTNKNDEKATEKPSDDDELDFSSDSDSEPPMPEAAGQIKIALFRVIASGEIKRGEYSPQFDAHDDDDEVESSDADKKANTNGLGTETTEIDHTTSFAKPKTLDPASISTQTVNAIDSTNKPYAVFTFLYRSERQLQKMGILHGPNKAEDKVAPTPSKRRSLQADLSKLPPLRAGGSAGFIHFRDGNSLSPPHMIASGSNPAKGRSRIDEDSDEEEIDKDTTLGIDEIEPNGDEVGLTLSTDIDQQGELAEAVRKIKLKRAHSSDLLADSGPRKSTASNTPTVGAFSHGRSSDVNSTTPPTSGGQTSSSSKNNINLGDSQFRSGGTLEDDATAAAATSPSSSPSSSAIVGSPMKKSRPSLAGPEDDRVRKRLGLGLFGHTAEVFATGTSISPAGSIATTGTGGASAGAGLGVGIGAGGDDGGTTAGGGTIGGSGGSGTTATVHPSIDSGILPTDLGQA